MNATKMNEEKPITGMDAGVSDPLMAVIDELNRLNEKERKLEEAMESLARKKGYDDKILELEEKIDELRDELLRVHQERDDATEKFRNEIHMIRDKRKELTKKKLELERQKAYEEFKENGVLTAEAIKGMLQTDGNVEMNVRGGKLKNGVRLVKLISDECCGEGDMRYLAFYGTKVIGVWTRRKSEHAGDDTRPYAFLTTLEGKTAPSDNNPDIRPYYVEDDIKDSLFNVIHKAGEVITYEKFNELTSKFGRNNVDAEPLTFNNWKKYLKSLTQEELENAPAMDVNDPVSRKMLTEWGWMW